MNGQVRQLCTKDIPMMKVLRRNHTTEDCTWETVAVMRMTYSYLFRSCFILLYLFEIRGRIVIRRGECNALIYLFILLFKFIKAI